MAAEPRTETPSEMAERHVEEGRERIARQQALIAQLARDGHEHMLPQAHDILGQMRDLQAKAQEHLARLQATGQP